MGRAGCSKSKRGRPRREHGDKDGFGAWGGYMDAKKAKLLDQFHKADVEVVSNIFEGVAIHVNGLTKPPADELKNLMARHGGVFHMYQVSSTTHIIASNLPNVKIKHLGSVPIVKTSWIVDSISLGKLLDYRRYLLYTNQSRTQPRIGFPVIENPSVSRSNVPEEKDESTEVIDDFGSTGKSVVDQRRGPTKTAADADFLEEFYSNSRLHLISTLGAEFKQLVGQLRDRSDGTFSGKDKLKRSRGESANYFTPGIVIMHIDMDCFFVSVGLRNHPELRGKPVAITHARNGQITNHKPDRRINREQEFALYSERLPEGVLSRINTLDANASMSEIASCSYEARKCGIKNGMFLGQAVKLCPELKTLPYDFEGYKEVSNMLYKTISSYTLDIEAVSCDEMYVDVTNILKETGLTVAEWATHIREEIMASTGCPCSAGFGANRLQARLATRKAKPAGQYYLQADDVEVYMAEIPLADLPGVGGVTLAKLRNLGLHTCGDVQVASQKVLQAEIGQKAGETLIEQSRGIDRKPLNFHHERKSVSAEINYGIRFTALDECYNFLQALSGEVYNRLNDIGMRARALTLKLLVRAADAPVETAKFLGCGVCDSLTKTASNKLFNDPQVIFKEVKVLYDKLSPRFVDLRGIGIQLTKLEKNAPISKALSNFLKQAPAKRTDTGASVTNRAADEVQADLEKQRIEIAKKLSLNCKQNATTLKRGKAIGAGNSHTLKGGNASLLKFFTERKGTQPLQKTQKTQVNPVCAQIDLNVLNELPEELRKEIIKEYQLEDKVKDSAYTSQRKSVEIEEDNKTPTLEGFSPGLYAAGATQEKKSPFKGLSWERIKPIIREWVKSDNQPSVVDVEMIAEHFKALAIRREIELLRSVFNFLHRVFAELNCRWHQAYFSIVNIMQQGMVARYGRTLSVKRQFTCCHI